MYFTEEEIERYSRNMLLPEIGAPGQERLRRGRVLVVGAGGLGSPVVLYLAAAGVGTIGVVDGERVERSNLQRQVVHFTRDVGRLKSLSATEKARLLNPGTRVVAHDGMLSTRNASRLVEEYDFVVEGTDNFATKYAVNDACVSSGVSFCTGGISGYEGQVLTRVAGTACYRCVFPTSPVAVEACGGVGVLGAVAGMAGTIMAAEALKFLTGVGELLVDRLLVFDARTMAFRRVRTARAEGCRACGKVNV
jgi:adenylyltransferase/sulfurtransferase